jgi:hypothetical protein
MPLEAENGKRASGELALFFMAAKVLIPVAVDFDEPTVIEVSTAELTSA